MAWTVHARDGKLALTLGWQRTWDEPIRERSWLVSNVPISRYPGLAGQQVRFNGNVGTVYWLQRDRTLRLNTDDADTWHREDEHERIRKPPKTKDYDYEWRDGEWRKVWN